MPEAIPYVLWSWVPVTLLLFWKLSPARAAAISLVGGLLLLPTAQFGDDVDGVLFPYWVIPSCLPSNLWTTKARVVGVSLLVGIMAFDARAWSRFRPSWLDLPMLGWCLVPLASGAVNGVSPIGSAADSAYLLVGWGVPYLAGRLYFADPAGLMTLARAIVGGGFVYIPACLYENLNGPGLYWTIYGCPPYQFVGASRYFGSRPIVLLEDGNQLGTWMAASALVAAWLWRSGSMPTFWKLPGFVVAGSLVVTSVLTQSAGAVGLMVAGLAAMELTRRVDLRWPLALILVLPVVFVGARAANLVDAKALIMRTSLGRQLADAANQLDRQSLGWRLRVEERATRVALQRPWLGWSRWDWWRASETEERPWGLFGLAMGAYGVVGLACLVAALAAPIAVFLGLGPPRFWIAPSRAAASAVAWSLGLVELDAVLNGNFPLVFAAGAGGLIGLQQHARAASAWIKRAQGLLG